MSSMNPQEYYENEENHGVYQYVTLEEMVINFMDNYTGDGTILGKTSRSKAVYQFKQGIKEFTMDALREQKSVELELGDTLDVIMPPDYLNWVRISYVNPETGELMVLSSNPKTPQATAYLQDHDAEVLFDDDGFVLEGTTYFAELNDKVTTRKIIGPVCGYLGESRWGLDVTKNANGTFNIDKRSGKIHFSSDTASRVIMLEYISDGLEYSLESDIKVHKLAEIALYNYVHYNLLSVQKDVPMYEKNEAKKLYYATFRNAKIKLLDFKVSDIQLVLNARNQWIR